MMHGVFTRTDGSARQVPLRVAEDGLLVVLGIPAQALQLAAGASSANAVLTASCRRISIHARGADIRFAIGSNTQNASATASHFIAAGERLDLALPATPNIAVIRAGTVDGTLEVMELI